MEDCSRAVRDKTKRNPNCFKVPEVSTGGETVLSRPFCVDPRWSLAGPIGELALLYCSRLQDSRFLADVLFLLQIQPEYAGTA